MKSNNTLTMPSESAKTYQAYEVTDDYRVAIPEEIYRKLAEQVRIECEYCETEYPKVKAEVERDGWSYNVEMSATLYYEEFREMWGNCRYLKRIVPTWVECHTYDCEGEERINDFDIKKFKLFFV